MKVAFIDDGPCRLLGDMRLDIILADFLQHFQSLRYASSTLQNYYRLPNIILMPIMTLWKNDSNKARSAKDLSKSSRYSDTIWEELSAAIKQP